MTSVLSIGKYRSRKDWSTSSIPTLVSLEEETNQQHQQQIIELNGTKPLKPPRRSSIAVSLLGGGLGRTTTTTSVPQTNERINKRRSSIAVAFLGRRDTNKNRDNINDVPVITDTLSNITKNEIPIINVSVPPNDNDDGFDIEKDKRRRRSSWATKLERRRRKGLTSPTSDEDIKNDEQIVINNNSLGGIGYNRQKRHSWWNIFVPENLKQRSRRASQDVGVLSRSADNIGPYSRSKSRSVDHGLAPYDLDSLRSKVDGRVDRLTKDNDKKKILIPTISYKVGDRDTLTSVAARFDTTPSELTALNRLASSFIYPGQNLLVPDKSGKDDNGDDSANSVTSSPTNSRQKLNSDDLPQEEKELLDGLRPGSPKPGHIERVSSPNTRNNDDDPVTTQRFLKINVRHITDGQGVVGGVLLVTPNAVMFDPNVSDPLVIEHGPESYGVIAPMELVVNAAIFHDIAHMRVGGGENNNASDKPEVYYPKSCSRCENTHSPGKDSLLVKELHFQDETFPELGVGSVEGCDDQESVCSSNEREGDAFPKAFERELVTPTNLQRAHGDSTESGSGSTDKPLLTTDIDNTKDKLNRIDGTTTIINSNDKTDDKMNKLDGLKDVRSLEERRRSLLDHHWAVPSKDKSLDDEEECQEAVAIPQQQQPPPISIAAIDDESSQLVKLSCHDSGIDIRDPNSLPTLQPIPAKKIYSDADIVLSSEWVPPLTIAPTLLTESSPKGGHTAQSLTAQSVMQTQNVETGGRKKTSSVSFSVEGDDSVNVNVDKTGETKKNKMLKRLSYPLAWVEGLTGETNKSTDSDSTPNTGDSNQSVFSKVFSRRSSIGTFIRPHSSEGTHSVSKPKAPTPKLDYRSMVSIDDMPELFVSFDKLIPRPARACPDPPLYLRLRMGRPIGKAPPLPTSVMSYGKNKLRPEYWFSIPKNRVDELYRFLNTWVPQLYGELDDDQVMSRGYELIQHDTEWAQGSTNKDGRSNSDGEITELTRESWEVLSMSTDDYRKASLFAPGSFDQDFPIPELIGQTEILTEEHREKLCSHLPARAEGYAWSLVFNTSQHGFSLNSLYRKMQRLESPVLIVIQDTENNVFGALTSCPLHVSDHFYGTGESLLYKFNPHFKVFHWSGENLYFIKGNPESLAIGAGDGKFGLWLDGDLNQGRSQRCSTYSNEPLAPQEDFVIKTLECWAFV